MAEHDELPEFSEPKQMGVPKAPVTEEASEDVGVGRRPHGDGGTSSAASRVMGFVKGAVATVSVPIVSLVTKTAAALGVPAKVVGVALATTAVVGVPTGVALVTSSVTTEQQMTLFVGDEECENPVQQAIDDAKKTGSGEIKVPDDVKTGTYTITGWGRNGNTPVFVYASGSTANMADPDKYVGDLWIQKGAKYDEGIATLDGLYLIACKPREKDDNGVKGDKGFGEVGDVISFYLADGTQIDCLVADSKGSDATSPWGHENGSVVNVIEFEVDMTYYHRYGNPGSPSWHPELGDGQVRSATNHGIHPDLVGKLGQSGGAVADLSKLGIKKAADAEEECVGPKANYDNSTLAAALASYSMSRSTQQSDSEPSSPIYQEVCEGVKELGPGDFCASYHYHSCDRGVAAAVYWTGADLQFPAGAPANQYSYCETSPLWEAVTEDGQPTDLTDEKAKSMGLEPGDIGITLGDHILAYVGTEAVDAAWNDVIKGLSGADVGEPEAGACMVSASAHTRGANIHAGYADSRGYKYFRYTGDYPDKDLYADLGSSATLAGTKVTGTSCDCLECGDDGEKPEEISGIVEFAKTFLGQPYVWGGSHGKGPNGYDDPNPHGTDCSGLVLTAYYGGAGIDVPEGGGGGCTGHHGGAGKGGAFGDSTTDVGGPWKRITKDEIVPGDIIVLPGHVVIYEGEDNIIENTGGGCREWKMSDSGYYSWGNTSTDSLCGIFHWEGQAGTDTTSSSTKRSATSGNGSCKEDCFSGLNFDDTYVMGDSVIAMWSTEGNNVFSDVLTGATINAVSGRSWETSADGDGYLAASTKGAGTYDRFVIEAGINDSGLTYEHGKEIYNRLNKTNTQIFFVNQYVTTNGAANDLTNETIDKLVSENSNCFKVDWKRIAESKTSEYLVDVCHLNEEGAKALAEEIKKVMSENSGCGSSSSTTGTFGNSSGDASFNASSAGSWGEAKASIYSEAENGSATASGIPFSDSGLTCAVPMSLVSGHENEVYGKMVQFEYNGKVCIAKITDCGGFGPGTSLSDRLFDISGGVASALGVKPDDWGVQKVKYRFEDKALDTILKL